MLTRLIESRYRFMRNDIGTAASVAIHLVLIAVAAFITTAKAIVDHKTDNSTKIHWVEPLQPSPSPSTSSSMRRHSTSISVFRLER